MPLLTVGARGDAVLDVQARLTALGYHIDPSEHGEFAATTKRAVQEFQQRRHLLVDGVVGEDTWDELVEAGYSLGDRVLYLRYPYDRGDDVRTLQASLNVLGFDVGREDGIFGQRTDRAVREFQRNVGLPPDGIVGNTTIQAVARLRPVGPGPGLSTVREGEALRRMSASLQGSRIAVDPGHGSEDTGAEGPSGLREADATFLLAEELVKELTRRGGAPFLLRDAQSDPPSSARATLANEVGAEVLISLHLNSHTEAAAEGASTYYYGREGWSSPAGQHLAEVIQEILVSRLGRKDGRTHPKSLPLLRETNMPAVHVEPCFITNPNEESLLKDENFRREVARGLTDAIERFFGRRSLDDVTPGNDQPAAVSLGGTPE
ncbi:MAG: N-acetylmuramoyl-L-alanine amidase [Actinomycetota bacterium]|nr:N-acetylmuramoyl-L-alanine amidase [Actinomycetota bacterium]